MREAHHLEEPPHAEMGRAGEAFERSVDLGDLRCWYCLTQHCGTAFDSKIAQERGLLEWAENARPHALSGLRQRLKIDMRGEVDAAWRLQRVGVGMLADRLERVAGRAFGMTVVDHQRSAQRVCQPPANLERNSIGAPFEHCADLRIAQRLRQHLLEQRDWIARVAELQP